MGTIIEPPPPQPRWNIPTIVSVSFRDLYKGTDYYLFAPFPANFSVLCRLPEELDPSMVPEGAIMTYYHLWEINGMLCSVQVGANWERVVRIWLYMYSYLCFASYGEVPVGVWVRNADWSSYWLPFFGGYAMAEPIR